MTATGIPAPLDMSGLAIHLPAAHWLATRVCGSRDAGEDLVQDTFIDRARVAARRPPRIELAPDDAGAPTSSEQDQALTRIEARDVLRAVAVLPGAYRDVVLAIDVRGRSCQAAADRYGTPIGTVMSRLSRGFRQVVRAVQDTVRAPTSRQLKRA